MNYPTLEEVESANMEQLASWSRFLNSPGFASAQNGDPGWIFQVEMHKEAKILERILGRIKEAGGMNPRLSKKVGWSHDGTHAGRDKD